MGKMTAQEVADYFLSLVDDEVGDNLSNLKLQKLVYYAQGFHLAVTGEPLFDENIEAWVLGPVVPELYRAYKSYRAAALPVSEDFNILKFDGNTLEILDEVYTVYGQFSAGRLVEMTHEEPPWKTTPSNAIITHDKLRTYFKTLVNDGE